MEKSNQKLTHKVAEKQEINPGKIIYIEIISEKKASYGGSKNWITIQDSDIKQNCLY